MKPMKLHAVLRISALFLLAPALLRAASPDLPKGGKTFSTNCAGCHGSDGRGGERAPNIVTTRAIVAMSDRDLQRVVEHGVSGAGMPSFRYLGTDGIIDVIGYLRSLQGVGETAIKIAGDPQAGHSLFFGKGGCTRCHMMSGKGGFIAPDLSGYGLGLSEAEIRRAIEDPDTHLQRRGSGVVHLQTSEGQDISGLLRSEDNFNLVVQSEDGRFHMLSKTDLVFMHQSSHSLMPSDFASRLSPQEIQDLISFLATNSAMHPDPERTTERSDVQ